MAADQTDSSHDKTLARTGTLASGATALLGVISLSVAVTTPPRSGPFADPATALTYPYLEAAKYVPRDFLWMYPALLMVFAFLVLAICIREGAVGGRRLFGTIGLNLASISVGLVGVAYFIQLQTLQPALLRGEAESVVALSQYNPHGVFITLENLAYLLMAISMGFLGASLGDSRLERATKWIYWICATFAVGALVALSWIFGFRLEYFYEVAVISVVWLSLIASGAMLVFVFRHRLRTAHDG